MHTESEFLAHIRANPDDDAPRLIIPTAPSWIAKDLLQ